MNKEIKLERIFAWIYLVLAIGCVISTTLLWNNVDTGFVRYGIILPIFFGWQAFRGFKKARELEVQNGVTKSGDTPHS